MKSGWLNKCVTNHVTCLARLKNCVTFCVTVSRGLSRDILRDMPSAAWRVVAKNGGFPPFIRYAHLRDMSRDIA